MTRCFSFLVLALTILPACHLRRQSSAPQASSEELGKSVFVSACTSADKKDADVLLAQALMQGVQTKDCHVAWQKLQATSEVMLSGFGIRDLKLLVLFPHLEELSLTDHSIQDLKPLASLQKLKKLNLSYNEIRDLTGLQDLTKLADLRLVGNKLSSLKPLASLTQLKVLDLSETMVADLSPLGSLKTLQSLLIADNEVVDLQPLSQMTALEQLSAANNQILSLKPIANLARLSGKRLNVEGNPIRKAECPTTGSSSAVTGYCLGLRGAQP